MSEFNDGRNRTIRIWTPPKYNENPNVRYPVIYMHDGQNLFDDGPLLRANGASMKP